VSALVDRFARVHRASPDRVLVHLPAQGACVTAGEIWRAHLAYADWLRAGGLRPGHLLVAATGNRAMTVPVFLAARALGVTIAIIEPGGASAEREQVAERFGAAALVVPGGEGQGDLPGPMPDDLRLIVRDVDTPGAHTGTALLKLTSGSTGLPKAARATDAQLIFDSEKIVAGMRIGVDDTQMAVIPLSHAYGTSVILVPLLLQGTPMVLRESFVPQLLPSDAAAAGARTFPGVPYMFEYFLANPPPDGWPSCLRTLISAGARLSPQTVRAFADRFGLKIHSFYGTSECGGISYDADDEVLEGDTVGTPLPGVTITLRRGGGIPEGAGRVHVRTASVGDGYVGETVEEYCDGGFLTGDYGAIDGRGRLTLTGRVSSFINVAGNKVAPAEVENVLRQMPGVRDVRVVAAADAQRGQQVVACLAVDPPARDTVTMLTVRRFCSARLAAYKIPRTVVILDAIPLTPRGKTDRRALDEAIRAGIDGVPQQAC
jgi:long-chain acyl-CoA synthetase